MNMSPTNPEGGQLGVGSNKNRASSSSPITNVTSNPNYSATDETTSFYADPFSNNFGANNKFSSGIVNNFNTNAIRNSYETEAISKWNSTGHVAFHAPSSTFRTSLNNEYASVDITNGGGGGNNNNSGNSHYRSLQPPHLIGTTAANQFFHGELPPPPPPPPPPLPNAGCLTSATSQGHQQQGIYNLGHYFPRVASEPPTRKLYHTSSREVQKVRSDEIRNSTSCFPISKSSRAEVGINTVTVFTFHLRLTPYTSSTQLSLDQQALPMAQTQWNMTTSVQTLCKNQIVGGKVEEIPRNQLRIKESFGGKGCLGEVSGKNLHFSNFLRTLPKEGGLSTANGIKTRPHFQVLLCEIETPYSNMPQTVAVRSVPSFSPRHQSSSSPSSTASSSKSKKSSSRSSSNSVGNDTTTREEFVRECRLLVSFHMQSTTTTTSLTIINATLRPPSNTPTLSVWSGSAPPQATRTTTAIPSTAPSSSTAPRGICIISSGKSRRLLSHTAGYW